MNFGNIKKLFISISASMAMLLASSSILEASNGYYSTNSTFDIFEIVPEDTDASFGYLIQGEEPLHYEREGAAITKKMRDMPAIEERKIAMEQLKEQIARGEKWTTFFGEESFASWVGEYEEKMEPAANSQSLYGIMEEDENGEYIVNWTEGEFQELLPGEVYEGETYTKWIQPKLTNSIDEIDTINNLGGKFIPTYALSLKGGEAVIELQYQQEGAAVIQSGKTNTSFAIRNQPIAIKDLSFEELQNNTSYRNQFVYQKDSSDNYTLYGKIIYDEADQTVKLVGAKDGKKYLFTDDQDIPGAYSIRFELNGQDASFPSGKTAPYNITTIQNSQHGEEVGQIKAGEYPENPIRNGYEFAEWNGEPDGNGIRIDENTLFTGNMNVYAIWKEITVSGSDVSGNYADLVKNNRIPKGHFYTTTGISEQSKTIDISNLYIMEFLVRQDGKMENNFYIKTASQTGSEVEGLSMTICYKEAENGNYKMVSEPIQEVKWIYDEQITGSKGTHRWVSDPNQIYETIWYSGGIHNQNWFLKYVLKDGVETKVEEQSNIQAIVHTMTMEQFNKLSNEELEIADLIYFSSGFEKHYFPIDITKEKSEHLMKKVITDKLPVILENSLINSSNPQLTILLKALVCNEEKEIQDLVKTGCDWNKMEKTSNNLFPTDNGYLAGCVYMNDNENLPYIGADYVTPMTPVSESFLHIMSGNITKASITQYILNYGKKEILTKNQLRVLWLEPCNDFQNEEYSNERSIHLSSSYVAKNWATGMGELSDEEIEQKISIKRMTTSEFNGVTDELKEKYDVIYIGANTGTMNVETTGENKGFPKYNDSSMDGLIYTHTGDYLDFGILNYPSWDRGPAEVLQHDMVKPNGNFVNRYRFSGNDITKGKRDELQNYIMEGFPVVFHDDFFFQDGSGVNTKRIDSNSYMYDLAAYSFLNYRGKNVNNLTMLSQKEMSVQQEEEYRIFKEAVNRERLKIEIVEAPAQYHEGAPGNQENTLNYIVDLNTQIEQSQLRNSSFQCQFYLDFNLDGRFSTGEDQNIASMSETIKDISIFSINNESEFVDEIQTNGQFNLKAGKRYRIQVKIPEDVKGFLYWKLQFTNNQNYGSVESVKGNTYICPTEKKEVKILQIMSIHGNNWDLSQDVNGEYSFSNLSKWINEFIPKVHAITFKDLTEGTFGKTQNSTMGIKALQKNGDQDAYFNYLSQYDLIVFGFANNYQEAEWNGDKTEILMRAIEEYIEVGNPAIFTNDVTSHYNQIKYKQKPGYISNKILRKTMGLDAYGVLGRADGSYDSLWFPNTGVQNRERELYNIEGYSNPTIARFFWQKGNHVEKISKQYLRNDLWLQSMHAIISPEGILNSEDTNALFNYQQVCAESLNTGQILQYPFDLGERIWIPKAHGQSYQLNLEKDDNSDGYSDVVVWYALADDNQIPMDVSSPYDVNPKDARNNYFSYNIGNVAYCGIGNQVPTTEEKKLFINTLVATYQMGIRTPKVKIMKDELTNQEEGYLYFPVDDVFLRENQEHISIFFEVQDRNINLLNASIEAHYYIEEKDVQSGLVSVNGKEIYLRELKVEDGIELYRYDLINRTKVEGDMGRPLSGIRYELVIPFELVFSIQNNIPNRNTGKIYVSVKTNYKKNGRDFATQESWANLDAVGVGLFDLK